MKGNLEDAAARVHDLIPHEYELNTRGEMQALIHQCKYEGAYEFDSIWDTLLKAFSCGYAMGHLATIEGKTGKGGRRHEGHKKAETRAANEAGRRKAEKLRYTVKRAGH